MLAKKANREYTIIQSEADYYQSQGFDIIDDDGTVWAYGAGKTVAYSAYAKLSAEYEELKTAHLELMGRYADLEAAYDQLRGKGERTESEAEAAPKKGRQTAEGK